MPGRVLVVEEDNQDRLELARILRADGFEVSVCSPEAQMDALLEATDVLIADQLALTQADLPARLASHDSTSVCLSLCEREHVPMAVADLHDGRLFQFLYKPYSSEAIRTLVRDACDSVKSNRSMRDPDTGWLSRAACVGKLDELLQAGDTPVLVVAEVINATSVLGLLRPAEQQALALEMSRRSHTVLNLVVDLAILDRGLFAAVFKASVPSQAVADLADSLAQPVSIGAGATHVKLRFGWADSTSTSPQDGAELIQQAMIALSAIETEEDATFEFSQGLRANLHYRFSLEQDLYAALRRREFFYLLQPKVDAVDSSVRGAEMLIRWEHRLHGLVSPLDFIDLAERTGLIRGIGFWILEQGIRELSELHAAGIHAHMAVNVSPRQFSEGSLAADIARLLDGVPFDRSQLELEVTESCVVKDLDHARGLLNDLKAVGVRIALDDFGTGHSSLSQLHQLPFDVVKFDRTFVCDLETDEPSRILLRHMVALARDLGLSTVAEGVETEGQQRICRELGCELLQGYRFYKPLRAGEFRSLVLPESAATGG
ncbi:MAG: EAL domain-containing protein [Pseudomonadaceae bacterium]|nr:EAL domain-containing protein [Pseudomonadaceae bacterium]